MNNTELIERLIKTASRGTSAWGDLQMEAAAALEVAQAKIERLEPARSHDATQAIMSSI